MTEPIILTAPDGEPAGLVDLDLAEARASALAATVAASFGEVEPIDAAVARFADLDPLEGALILRIALVELGAVTCALADRLGYAAVDAKLALRRAEVDAYEALAKLTGGEPR